MSEHECVEAGDPRYDGFRITELWAFCSVDPDDDQEGIVMWDGKLLLASDIRRTEHLRQLADDIERIAGRPIAMKHFRLDE